MSDSKQYSFSSWEATTNGFNYSVSEQDKDCTCTIIIDKETGKMRAIINQAIQGLNSRVITLVEKPPKKADGKVEAYGTKRVGPSGRKYLFLRGQKSQKALQTYKANLFFADPKNGGSPVDRLVLTIDELPAEAAAEAEETVTA